MGDGRSIYWVEKTGVGRGCGVGGQALSFHAEMPVELSSWVQRLETEDQGVLAGVYVWVLLVNR